MSYYELGKTFQSPLYANLLQEAMLKQQQQAAGLAEEEPLTYGGKLLKEDRIVGDKTPFAPSQTPSVTPENNNGAQDSIPASGVGSLHGEGPYSLIQTGSGGGYGRGKVTEKVSEDQRENMILNLMENDGLSRADAEKKANDMGLIVGQSMITEQTVGDAAYPLFDNYTQTIFGREAQRISTEGTANPENYHNQKYDIGEKYIDTNKNHRWDPGEHYWDEDLGEMGAWNQPASSQFPGNLGYGPEYSFAYMPPEALTNFEIDPSALHETADTGPLIGQSDLGKVYKEGIFLAPEQNKPIFLTGDPEVDAKISEELAWLSEGESLGGRKFVPWSELEAFMGSEAGIARYGEGAYEKLLADAAKSRKGNRDKSIKLDNLMGTDNVLDLEDLIFLQDFTPGGTIGGALGEAVPVGSSVLRGMQSEDPSTARRQKEQYLNLLLNKYYKMYDKNIQAREQ